MIEHNQHGSLATQDRAPGYDTDAWLSVLEGGIEGATEKTVEGLVVHGLAPLLTGIVTEAVAGTLSGVIGVLLRRLFDHSKIIAERLQLILDEPFLTASQTLRDISLVDIRSPEELQECRRQLALAFDNLSKAYTLAKVNAPGRLQVIRFYQCLTAALMSGGRPFAELYLAEFGDYIAKRLAEATDLQTRSDAIDWTPSDERHFQEGVRIIMDERKYASTRQRAEGDYGVGPIYGEERKSAKEGLAAQAREIRERCDRLQARCAIVTRTLAVAKSTLL